jgi:hypothetical protein
MRTAAMTVGAINVDIQIRGAQVRALACDAVILGRMAVLTLQIGTGCGHVNVITVIGSRTGRKSEISTLNGITTPSRSMACKTFDASRLDSTLAVTF